MRLNMPSVETKRLWLRPIEEADACDMFAYLGDERVTKFLSTPCHKDVDVTLHWIQKVLLPYANQQDFETLAILRKEDGRMIGHLGLHSLEEDKAQLSYILHPAYWNQGYAKEAVAALLKIGFTICDLHRIEAFYEHTHVASAHVLASCGFHVEGRLRQYVKLCDGCYHDVMIAALIEEEYKGE